MPNRRWTRWSLGGLALAGLAWGCSQEASQQITASQPTARPTPGKISFAVSGPPPVQNGVLTLCKDAPAGTSATFEFDVTVTNSDGSTTTVQYFIKPGQCMTFPAPNGAASYSVVENLSSTAGWSLVSVTSNTTAGGTVELSGNGVGDSSASPPNPVTCSVSSTTGCVLTFHNSQTPPPPPPPPTGKTFSIGPSSMEGDIYISNGDWVNGGYSFSFASGGHAATNYSVQATVSLTGPCVGGGPATDTFTFPLNAATYAVPAGNTSWLPTGDQNSVLSWEGSAVASGVCGGIGKLHASHGAVFTATVSQSPATGSLVNFRFKYRDPAAKGKPNTNCLDTSDPNRAKADVCGASWSQTVRDP